MAEEFKKLKEVLADVVKLLVNTKEKGLPDEPHVKDWLSDLKCLSTETQDLLTAYKHEERRRFDDDQVPVLPPIDHSSYVGRLRSTCDRFRKLSENEDVKDNDGATGHFISEAIDYIIASLSSAYKITDCIISSCRPAQPTFAEQSVIKESLNRLKAMVKRIKARLVDAEEQDIRDDHPVNKWFLDLKRLSCEAEDLLENYEQQESIRQLPESQQICHSSFARAINFIRALFLKMRASGNPVTEWESLRQPPENDDIRRSPAVDAIRCIYDLSYKMLSYPSLFDSANGRIIRSIHDLSYEAIRDIRLLMETNQVLPPIDYSYFEHEIRDIYDRFNQITSKDRRIEAGIDVKDESHVKENKMNNLEDLSWRIQRRTDADLRGMPVYGRDDDKANVIRLLRSADSAGILFKKKTNSAGIPVVAIVGMGGVGKTTLVKDVYNDALVSDAFEKKAWVCVSENFDVVELTKDIFKNFTGRECPDFCQLELLQEELYNVVKGNKFLLVMDDVWTQYIEPWDTLFAPLVKAAAPGSRVLLTTRSELVAYNLLMVELHRLSVLSFDDCWLIFHDRALNGRCLEPLREYECMGKKIVRKCHGLPLAVEAIAGLLLHKDEISQWREVFESDMWRLDDVKDKVLAPLKLSYLYLPSHLKPCFAYCSVFPKDAEIDKLDLVYQWIARGFVVHAKDGMSAVDMGMIYVRDLLSRSLFMEVTEEEEQFLSVHDLLHTLAENIFKGECPIVQQSVLNRLASVKQDRPVKLERDDPFNDLRMVRSFICRPYNMTGWEMNMVFSHLKYLRVLDLEGLPYNVDLEGLPCIGEMKHLRYLKIGHLHKDLPNWIRKLHHLQILILRNETLSTGSIPYLTNLQHLIINFSKGNYFPIGIGRLTCLETFESFHVGSRYYGKAGIEELKDLEKLRGRLSIKRLENVTNIEDAKAACLVNKKHITDLSFNWSNSDSVLEQETYRDNSDSVLEALKPCTKLVKLIISGFPGCRIPSWLQQPTFPNLVEVIISDCQQLTVLPPLGQLPLLKKLQIISVAVETIGLELYYYCYSNSYIPDQFFPSLETLEVWGCSELKKWEIPPHGRICFPHLQKLILNCINLMNLPSCFSSLTELLIDGFRFDDGPRDVLPLLAIFQLELKRVKIMCLSDIGNEVSIPIYNLPSLENLDISYCAIRALEFRSPLAMRDNHVSSLKKMKLTCCRNLRFPDEEQLPVSLEYLNVYDCPHVEEWCRKHEKTKLADVTVESKPY